MSILDLACKYSVSFSKGCCDVNVNNKILLLGSCCYDIYLSRLYFDFPPYCCLKNLKSAALILFKIPILQNQDYEAECECNGKCGRQGECYCIGECGHRYIISPLLEFFSAYSSLYSVPKSDFNKKIKFKDDTDLCYTEVDITSIVDDWVNDSLENRGLLLMGDSKAELICYASEKNDIPGTHPIIRLIYKDNTRSELSMANCTVKVKN